MRPEQIIVTHAGTDFDALGAALAARRLYPDAVICLQGGLNRNVREFVALYAEELDLHDASRLDLGDVRSVVVVEVSDLGRLGDVAEVIRRPGVETALFDHHGGEAPDWVSPGHVVFSEDGALCSTMVGILAERGIEPTPAEATALALGVHEDTGSLTYPSTTLRDVEALAFCSRHGAGQELIGRFLHSPLSNEQRSLLSTLVETAEPLDVSGVQTLLAAVRWPHYVDGVSGLASKIIDITDCEAIVMLVEMAGRVFAVGRSRTPALDVAAVMAALGGGGHPQAASAIVRDQTLEAVRERVRSALPSGTGGAPTASQIMSRPPWFLEDGTSIEDALAECRKRRTSGVQLSSGGMLVGTVDREDLGRAIAHGLAHAPVRAVMSSSVDAVAAGAGLGEVQRAIVRGPGRVPVTEAGGPGPHPLESVLGIVTRSDVLEALGTQQRPADVPADAELAARLLALSGLKRLWTAVEAISEDGPAVYLVGGAVRDLLLEEPSFDIDLAVEGDGIEVGRRLAEALGGRSHGHEAFHTAVVIAGDLRVDVASARTEHYERPGALPVVERSSIVHDLMRRDFTINAMAVALAPDRFGTLVDPHHGADDLRAGVIRVLHNLSFIEDPTRLFRAVRYENRFAFAMNAATRELARSCVEMGLVGDVSGARLRDELVAILSEAEISAALRRLDELGLAAALHPRLRCGPEEVARVSRLDELRLVHAPELPAWRSRLGALCEAIGADELLDWLEQMRLRRREARVVAAAACVPARLAAPLARAEEPARVAELLAPQPLEVALRVAAGDDAAASQALLYLERLRSVSLDIDGDTLRAELGLPESPRLGEVLAELLRRKRNGELGGADEQLEVARALVEEVAT